MSGKLPNGYRTFIDEIIDDWPAFERAHEQPSPVSIRTNPHKIDGPFELERVPWNQNGFYLARRPHFTMDPWFHGGIYYPQEPGSMLLDNVLCQLSVEKENLRVLDLCAAPGGKSTLLLDWLNGEGFLVANEVIGKRARVLQENLDKWGHSNRLVSNSDPKHFKKLGKVFDIVVVDAPCSGEGMFRKEPDALKMWSEELVEHCSQRQQRIVHDAIACLKPGGYLIYSTCTYNTLENEDVLAPLLQEYGAHSVSLNFPENWNISLTSINGIFGCRCWPHHVQSEGFFISAIQLPKAFEKSYGKKHGKNQKRLQKEVAKSVENCLREASKFAYLEHHDRIHFLPKETLEFAKNIASKIHVLTIGVEAGRIIRGELIPAVSLALCVDLDYSQFGIIELDEGQIIDYLSKLDIPNISAQSGWVIVTFQKRPIGWGKIVDGRLKNHWPKEWRILHATKSVDCLLNET